MNRHWTTEPTEALDIKMGSSGAAAYLPRTIIDVFQDTVTKHGSRPALALKRKGPVNNLLTSGIAWVKVITLLMLTLGWCCTPKLADLDMATVL